MCIYYQVKNSSPEAMLGGDNWCWEQSFINVVVASEDVKGIVFVQKGFWVNVISSHDVDAYLTQADGSRMSIKIKVSFII